jgi:hypothetical protein
MLIFALIYLKFKHNFHIFLILTFMSVVENQYYPSIVLYPSNFMSEVFMLFKLCLKWRTSITSKYIFYLLLSQKNIQSFYVGFQLLSLLFLHLFWNVFYFVCDGLCDVFFYLFVMLSFHYSIIVIVDKFEQLLWR